SDFAVSNNGVLVYPAASPISRLVWFDRHGKELGQVGAPGFYDTDHRLSPDGQKVLFALEDERTLKGDVWTHDLARNSLARLTFGIGDSGNAVWSPDGRSMVFFSYRGTGKPTVYIKEFSDPGVGESPLPPGFQDPTDWSSDGKLIAYTQR